MPPRPRPRPRVVAANPVVQPDSGPPSAVSPTDDAANKSKNSEGDIDSFFMKNRGPNKWNVLKTREQRENLAASTQPQDITIMLDDDEDGGEEDDDDGEDVHASIRRRQRKRERGGDGSKHLSKFDSLRLGSLDRERPRSSKSPTLLTDEEDDDDGFSAPSQNRKRKARSRSITPPPSVPLYQLQHAREVVRQAVFQDDSPRRPEADASFDLSSHSINLPPELAAIAQSMKRGESSSSDGAGPSNSNTSAGRPETVKVKVTWVFHPDDAVARNRGEVRTQVVEMKRTDRFGTVMDQIAEEFFVMRSTLVLMVDGRQIFSSGSPDGLNVWSELSLEACEKPTYDFIMEQRHKPPEEQEPVTFATPQRKSAANNSSPMGPPPAAVPKLKLFLRSRAFPEKLQLQVTNATKWGSVVSNYLKHHQIVGKDQTAKVEIDGEAMEDDDKVGDAGLEDGDLVEIVGV